MVSTVQTVPYVLTQHRDRDEADRPVLLMRYISRNDRLRIEREFAAADAVEDETYFDHLRAGIQIALAGWEKYPISFDANRLDDVLSDGDYAELRRNLIAHIQLSEIVKKNLSNLRQSEPGASASGADATATNVPPTRTPSSSADTG